MFCQLPANACKFYVTGLTPNEKYVFSIAAYTADGQLIGGSVGNSTKPILASSPTNVILALSYLCQVDEMFSFCSLHLLVKCVPRLE